MIIDDERMMKRENSADQLKIMSEVLQTRLKELCWYILSPNLEGNMDKSKWSIIVPRNKTPSTELYLSLTAAGVQEGWTQFPWFLHDKDEIDWSTTENDGKGG